MPEKRPRNADKSRQDILLAAEDHFARKGFYGARVDEIAAQAGLNKRMIYEYFGSKEELYKNVLAAVYQRLGNAEQKLQEQGLDGRELIQAIISLNFQFLRSDRNFVSIMLWENLNQGQALRELPAQVVQRPTIGYFRDMIRNGKQTGIFRAEIDEEQVVISLITVCFGNFSNCHTLSHLFDCDLCSDAAIESRKQHTVDLMLAYLCP